MALISLHQSHPDILISYDAAVKLYTLHGTYSKVQTALAQLLGNPDSPVSAVKKDSGQPGTDGSRSVQIAQTPHAQESEDQSRNSNQQSEESPNVHVGRSSDDYNPGLHRDVTPGCSDLKDTGSALQPAGPTSTSEEDLLLIVDADMFQYLQKHWEKEFQLTVNPFGIDVVHVTNEGLTSLYRQAAAGKGEEGKDKECIELAREAIRSFFLEKESKICRDQLQKGILFLRGGLQKAKEILSIRLPKLLVNEDDENIYVIGSSHDIFEAKTFLLDYEVSWSSKEDAASFRFPSHESGSSSDVTEQSPPLAISTTLDPMDNRIDQLQRSEDDERRHEAAGRYKLAAQFKDSGLAVLGRGLTNFNLRGGRSPPGRQTRTGPVLGHDVLSETAQIPAERASWSLPQNTGGDILFKSREAFPSAAYMKNKTSLTSHLFDTRPKGSTSHPSTAQLTLSGSTSIPPAGSGHNLKRANSFSGMPQQRVQVTTGQESQDDTVDTRVRARASSLCNPTGKDRQLEQNAEVTVSFIMWRHIKDAYSARLDDLTSDVQMKETRPVGSSDVTLTLRGVNSSKVTTCQQGLQKLFDSVSVDFSVQELPLSELGIIDQENDTLQACCTEVRNRFKKVTIDISKNILFLIGPRQLCSQVGNSLREIFSVDLTPVHAQQDFQTPSTSKWDPSTCLPTNWDQSPSLHCHGNPQGMLESQTSKANGTGRSQARITNSESAFQEAELVNGSIRQPLSRIDPFIKEKVKILSATERERQSTDTVPKHSETENTRSYRNISSAGSTPTPLDKETPLNMNERTKRSLQKDSTQQRQAETGALGESKSGVEICVCGETEQTMSRTKCGATMCSKCLDTVHVHCRVCHVSEPTSPIIQGKMNHSKLHISIPGHKKHSSIKITYFIPDGVQEAGHPFPGEPFQGGVFEAFLPDCEKARKLLPRMEKAFRKGLTFTLVENGSRCRVTWDNIPHKTSIHGGKSANGYPDSTYLTRLSEVLTFHGIKEPPAESDK
ncbi:uncharacterized protein si:busm1-163l24.3 isoform X2 [Antennarius striatus]